MKKLILSAATLMLATAFSFAGTPETKAEVKAKPEVKTETASQIYHYVSQNPNGTINFAPGAQNPGTPCTTGPTPCEWSASSALTSPLSVDDIEAQGENLKYRP